MPGDHVYLHVARHARPGAFAVMIEIHTKCDSPAEWQTGWPIFWLRRTPGLLGADHAVV